jgi:hypothetical protein
MHSFQRQFKNTLSLPFPYDIGIRYFNYFKTFYFIRTSKINIMLNSYIVFIRYVLILNSKYLNKLYCCFVINMYDSKFLSVTGKIIRSSFHPYTSMVLEGLECKVQVFVFVRNTNNEELETRYNDKSNSTSDLKRIYFKPNIL